MGYHSRKHYNCKAFNHLGLSVIGNCPLKGQGQKKVPLLAQRSQLLASGRYFNLFPPSTFSSIMENIKDNWCLQDFQNTI